MSKMLVLCSLAALCLTACPAEETNNNDADAGDMGSNNGNPAECPDTPPPTAEPCNTEGLACSYLLDCPCGPREDFVWTCTGGMLTQPSLTCSTGPATSCATNDMNTGGDMATPGDMGMDMPVDMNTAVDMGTDMPPDMAAPRLEAHGCTYDAAMDQTGNATVVITDLLAWDLGHNDFCIKVDAGTIVTWNGNFTAHPLDGGVSPNADPTSPIEIAGSAASGVSTVDVTLTDAGDYPYYCGIHTGIMRGVIYVD